jgi:hypothetical protein
MSVNVIVKNKYKKMANANVKSFDEYMSSRNEEVVHGTPGEDTSKWKGDESGKDLFEINEDSCCSTDCQKMVKEMYETMCKEMKACHGGESKLNAEDYFKACSEMMEACNASLKEDCNKYMNRK